MTNGVSTRGRPVGRFVRVVSLEEGQTIEATSKIPTNASRWEQAKGLAYEEGQVVFLFDASIRGWEAHAKELARDRLDTDGSCAIIVVVGQLHVQKDDSAFHWNGAVVHFGTIDLSLHEHEVTRFGSIEAIEKFIAQTNGSDSPP